MMHEDLKKSEYKIVLILSIFFKELEKYAT